MAFIRTKFINGRFYYYLVESKRISGKIYQNVLEYLGPIEEAEKYALQHNIAIHKPSMAVGMQTALDKLLDSKTERLMALQKDKLIERRVIEEITLFWTYNSTAIEGSTLNLNETGLILHENIASGGKNFADYQAALGHREAVDFVFKMLEKGKTKLDREDLIQIHRLCMKNIVDSELVGRYRNVQVWLRGVSFVPPPPEQVPVLMGEFLERINKNPEKRPPIVLSAISHADFESIHPFGDGNGRVGRILANFILLKNRLPPIIIEAKEKAKYFRALQSAQQKHDYSPIIYLFKRKLNSALDFYLLRFDSTYAKKMQSGHPLKKKRASVVPKK